MKITSNNLLSFIVAYFDSIGLKSEAKVLFTSRNFVEGLILKLPAVCLVPKNKPSNSRSNQTHIHITGYNRSFFFDRSLIATTTSSTDDYQQKVDLSVANMKSLQNSTNPSPTLDIVKSFTLTKIACRATQDSQVQVSKLRMEGYSFIELRECLYEDDLLVFLKYRNSDELFAIGIPKSFYESQYEFESDFYTGLESVETITVRNALASVIQEYSETDIINESDLITDTVYQEMVNTAEPTETLYEPEEYEDKNPDGKTTKSNRPSTNPSLGKEAIKQNNYNCAIDDAHITFVKKDGTKYMEVHHLIPLEFQSDFVNRLDTKANLISVCPHCHRLLHYGNIEDIKVIVTKLYNERKELLEKSGLSLTLEKLISYYS